MPHESRKGARRYLRRLVELRRGAAAETPVERGAYLVTAISACGNCHTPRDATGTVIPGTALSGGFEFHEGFGDAIAPNITPDPETGIGKWTDAQVITALREGKRPDGRTLGPPMPFFFYRGIADEDAAAIVAYIRSIKPIRHAVGPSEYKAPLPASYGPPVGHVTAPPKTDKVAYGAYLAGPIAHCLDCHTPFASPGKLDLSRLGAGGRELHAPGSDNVHVISRNITPDPQDGIGKWSDADIKRAITTGVRPDGTKLLKTMAFDWYKNISPGDLDALVAYLRSMKPQKTP
jgi:mono/diheme cytochrome c family protein